MPPDATMKPVSDSTIYNARLGREATAQFDKSTTQSPKSKASPADLIKSSKRRVSPFIKQTSAATIYR